jgi:chromosome segregation ATPase
VESLNQDLDALESSLDEAHSNVTEAYDQANYAEDEAYSAKGSADQAETYAMEAKSQAEYATSELETARELFEAIKNRVDELYKYLDLGTTTDDSGKSLANDIKRWAPKVLPQHDNGRSDAAIASNLGISEFLVGCILEEFRNKDHAA